MKKGQLIQTPLVLPHQIPLFDYNVNFHGLKKLLQDFNITLNSHKEEIDYLKDLLQTKSDKEVVDKNFSLINGALDLSKLSLKKICVKQVPGNKDKQTITQIVDKLGFITTGLDKSLMDSSQTDKKVSDLDAKMEDRLKRLQDQLVSKNDNLDKTITKNVESYFKDVSTNIAKLQADLKESESKTAGRLGDAFVLLDRKINDQTLDSKIAGVETKLLGKMNLVLDEDGMKRVKLSNDLIMSLKNTEAEFKDKYVSMERVLSQLMAKTSQSQTKSDFEKERNKIFQGINQAKSRLDDVQRKIQDFFQFKRGHIVDNEKSRVEAKNTQSDIVKLKEKMSSSAGMSNVQGLLEKLDPHKICEIDNMCRLHTDQIGKLERRVMELSESSTRVVSSSSAPQKGQALGAEEIMKLIKEYLYSIDVESRIKKSEVDIKDFNSSIDLIKDMDRKIQTFTKEFDYGFLIKELQRRCIEDNTRRESKITNGRIDQLHEFMKLLRKDLESMVDYIKSMDAKSPASEQNALLTGKKLYPINCLSCQPGQNRRRSNRKIDSSMDHTVNSRMGEEDIRKKMLASFSTVRR